MGAAVYVNQQQAGKEKQTLFKTLPFIWLLLDSTCGTSASDLSGVLVVAWHPRGLDVHLRTPRPPSSREWVLESDLMSQTPSLTLAALQP